MTQSFFNAQYQGAVRTQGFQPEQVPDISPQLRQNLNTEQQAFNNLAQALNREPQKQPLTELAGFSETLANTLVNLGKKEFEKQRAEGIALYYEDRAAQDAALTEQQANVAQLQTVDTEFKSAASNALLQGAPFEVADKIKGLSGWKKYGYAQATAMAAGRGYKDWMLNRLQSSNEKIIVNAGTPEEREISVNDQNLNLAESAAVRAHLRTQYLRESGLANLSRGLQAEAFKPMHEADAELQGLARKTYAINKSQEDEQAYIGTFSDTNDFGQLITSLTTLVDENGRPYGRDGAWKRASQYLVDRALNGEDVNFEDIYSQTVPWDTQGRTFGQLYGKAGQRLKVVEIEISKAKVALYKQEEAEKAIEGKKFFDRVKDELLGRAGGFTVEDVKFFQEQGLREGYGRSSELDQLAETLSLDAEQKESLDKQAEQLYKVGMLTNDFVSQLPPDLFRKWGGLAEMQEKAMEIPESKVHLDALANHVKAVTGASSVKNLGGADTLIIGELQRQYRQKVAQVMASGQVSDPVGVHNAAFAEVMNEFNAGFKTKGSRYFYQNGFPNYMPQVGGGRSAQQARQFLLDRYQVIKNVGLQSALDQPQFIMSDARMEQVVKDYGKPTFRFPPEVMHFAQQYNMSPLDILNRQLKASRKAPLPAPSSMGVLKGNSAANEAFINRYNTEYRSARYTGRNGVWQDPSSFRPGITGFERPASVVYERPNGQPGVDLYFPSKRFPAVLGGVVKDVSKEGGYGNYIVVESIDPVTNQKVDVLYAHLADGSVQVRPGQRIRPGQIIGQQGGTGNVRSADGTIASIDFLAPRAAGSKDMTPYQNFDQLRRRIVASLQGETTPTRGQPTTRPGGGLTGIATFYRGSGGSDGVAGGPTANGEIYDPNKMTAAVQWSLRNKYLNKFVTVEDLDTGKRVRVWVNDVGQMGGSNTSINQEDPRVIDLSPAAFKELFGSTQRGVGRIRIIKG